MRERTHSKRAQTQQERTAREHRHSKSAYIRVRLECNASEDVPPVAKEACDGHKGCMPDREVLHYAARAVEEIQGELAAAVELFRWRASWRRREDWAERHGARPVVQRARRVVNGNALDHEVHGAADVNATAPNHIRARAARVGRRLAVYRMPRVPEVNQRAVWTVCLLLTAPPDAEQ